MQKCKRKSVRNDRNSRNFYYGLLFLLITVYYSLFTVSCGYHMVGSKLLPFNSITIKPVQNTTYEPRLEERLHNALSKEFINEGIEVKGAGGDAVLEATVTTFELGAIAAVDDKIKEQVITMRANIKLNDRGKITEFRTMESPIKITFQTTGAVSDSVAEKERATDKACVEIAKEIVGRIVMTYAK